MTDNPETAFPASERTPGQATSRTARQRLLELAGERAPVWWRDYLDLRAQGWDWRKATYIAWASSPAADRWPATQEELARDILGLRTDRTIRKWKEKYPEIDERVAELQAAPLMRHRRDVFDALVAVARSHDPKAFSDRKLFLTMTGDYKERQTVSVGGDEGSGPVRFGVEFGELTDEELAGVGANLLAVLGLALPSGEEADGE